MPELPEVTTTVLGLQKEAVGWTIKNVWTDLAVQKPSRKDFYETIKYEPFFEKFKKLTEGQKIIGSSRRAKNILIHLSNKYTILVHLKMTGHMMVGQYKYNKKNNKWSVDENEKNEALRDSYNKYIHVVWTIEKNKNQKSLVLCDARKFAKVTIFKTDEMHDSLHLKSHGPEPLNINSKDISFSDFEKSLNNAPAPNRPIKTFIMDTRTISGVGNIYSDELLFRAGVHPKSIWQKIPRDARKKIYNSMLLVLKKGIDFGGDSTSDYRNIYGQPGKFHENHLAYKMKGRPCSNKKCKGIIVREVINGRSAHFCPNHQQIFN